MSKWILFLIVFNFIKCVVFENSTEEQIDICFSEETHPICLKPECIHSAVTVLNNIDESIEPCEDFYKFACGGFIKKNTIPEDKSMVVSFDVVEDQLLQQIRIALEEPVQHNEPRPFTLTKRYYRSCLNTTHIEIVGIDKLKSVIKQIGGWPVLENDLWNKEEFDWQNVSIKMRRYGGFIANFVSIYPEVDLLNSSRYILNCNAPSFGLSREYLIEGLENRDVKAYYDYLVDIAVEFGADKDIASKELREAVAFEISLAKITPSSEEYRNLTAFINIMSVSDLENKFPFIRWKDYINDLIGIPDIQISSSELINVAVLNYISKLEGLLKNTPKRVQANYLVSHIAFETVQYLTENFRKRFLEYKKVLMGTTEMKPRWKECVEDTLSGLKIASGALYIRKYFEENAKLSATELFMDLHTAFNDMLKNIKWIDDLTRQRALEKSQKMFSHIAYSDELRDDDKLNEFYSTLHYSSDYYLEVVWETGKFIIDNLYKKLRKIVNKTDWTTHSRVAEINAFYSISENSIIMPAGILQGIFFNHNRPNYMNYAAIGSIIGHEITHGFDDIGSQFDADGDLSEWWEEATKVSFMNKTQCVIEQYGNFTQRELNMNLHGVNTQSENIADIGGIKQAYLAYQSWVERNGEEPRLPGLKYTPKQLFWISYGNLWCSKERKAYIEKQILTDSHSPTYFRVLGSLKNSEFFARDFNCPIDSNMNPKVKCEVW